MEISKLRSVINSLVTEMIEEEEEIEEATVTGDIEGYDTPMAFTGNTSASKKKNKRISTNSTGYVPVNEAIDDSDIGKIKKIIRAEVGNILRDIWLKRNAWNK